MPQHTKPTSNSPACNRKQLPAVPVSLLQQMEAQKKSQSLRRSEKVFVQEMMRLALCTKSQSEQETTDLQKDFTLCDQRPFTAGLAHCP